MLACGESNFPNFKFEYLRKNEFLRKTVLACLSGAQMGSIYEKNWGRKSRDTATFSFYLGKQMFQNIHLVLEILNYSTWLQLGWMVKIFKEM